MKKLNMIVLLTRIAYDDPPPVKTFTQEQLNTILAEEKRKDKEKNEKFLNELKALKESGLTPEAKQQLEERIKNLEGDVFTKEQLGQQALEKAKADAENLKKGLESDRDNWKGMYTEQTINNSLISAALTHKAINHDQIVPLLRGNTRLVEALDGSGKPTGKLVPEVLFKDTDPKSGAAVELKLTPDQAVKRMRENTAKYGNLFEGTKLGGAGGAGDEGATGKKFVSGSQADYEANRKSIIGT